MSETLEELEIRVTDYAWRRHRRGEGPEPQPLGKTAPGSLTVEQAKEAGRKGAAASLAARSKARRKGWMSMHGSKFWNQGAPCPGCGHAPEVHAKFVRGIGCQSLIRDNEPGVCTCRRLRYENPPAEVKV